MSKVSCKFTPDIDKVVDVIHRCVQTMVDGVKGIVRVEYRLFQPVESLDVAHIPAVRDEEEVVVQAKETLKEIILHNYHGPIRYAVLADFRGITIPITTVIAICFTTILMDTKTIKLSVYSLPLSKSLPMRMLKLNNQHE